MRPHTFQAWAVVGDDGEVRYQNDDPKLPAVSIYKPTAKAARNHNGHIERVFVTITPAKRAAKRGRK